MKYIGLHKNNRAIAVIRVSTLKQVDGSSQDLQEQKIGEYSKEKGLEIVRLVRIAESAKRSVDRKKYKAARSAALKEGIRHFLYYMPDRECRNFTDMEENEELARAGIIEIHYVNDRKVLNQDSSDSDFMIRAMQAMNDSQFSRILSRKVSDAIIRKAQTGWFPFSQLPLGYVHVRRKDADGNELRKSTIVGVDPDLRNVNLVRKEFELRAQGLSLLAIRDRCLELGIVPDAIKRSYTPTSVEKHLKNKFYWGKFDVKGVEYIGKHELIVPLPLREAVSASFGSRPVYGRRFRGEHGIFGGGFLRCAHPECGSQITYDPKKKKIFSEGIERTYHYYHCANGRKVHTNQTIISEEVIWKEMEKVVDSICITEVLAKRIAEALNEAHRKVEAESHLVIQQCQEEIKRLDKRKDGLFDLRIGGEMNDFDFKSAKQRIDSEREKAFATLERAQSHINGKYRETAKSILELSIRAKELWKTRNAGERVEFLKLLLSNQVMDGKTLRFEMKKPFSVLAKMASSEKWRSLRARERTP